MNVAMHNRQPAAIDPESCAMSSTTYRLHTPFGSVPSNANRLTFPLAAGAGAGKTSPLSKFRGWNWPATIAPEFGIPVGAVGSSMRSIPPSSEELPASDMNSASCPVGPTRSMSRSSGHVCVNPTSFTRTPPAMVPVAPLTVIVEG